MRMWSGSLLIFLYSFTLNAQEVLTGIPDNPVAREFYTNYSPQKKAGVADTLELPFIDDFSSSFIVPDPEKWSDKHAFINSTYPVNPITVGVATLDALKFDGSHYQHASTFPYPADHLTSKPINLALSPSDNVWLSFFYQPEGLGEMPEASDSLCVDFYDTEANLWVNVWGVPGQALKPFERVMLNINDERFLKKGFRFRFRNYASLPDHQVYPDYRDNKDHWHIDYVKLDKNRSATDTVLRDVAFTEPIRTILKDYESIPWRHFEQAYFTQRKPFIIIKYANYDTIIRNTTRVLTIRDLVSGYQYAPQPTANDIGIGETTQYDIPFDYPFNFGVGDSADFLIRTILRTDAFDYKPNDTLSYIQKFKDYYALDDRSAEAGYGLRGLGTKNASVAVKFNTFREDTLRAVDMYFNQLPDSANRNFYFYLSVWDNSNGKPGDLLHSQIGMRPEYTGSLNRFYRYNLDSAIMVKDTFFIGFTQTVEKLMNVGFDRNRNNSSRNFYTSGGIWSNSSIPGTIMMRPVVSLNPLVSTNPIKVPGIQYVLYPNPAADLLYLELTDPLDSDSYYVHIFDLSGRKVLDVPFVENSPLDVSGLKDGLYLLKLQNRYRNTIGVQKLLIHK